MAEKNEKKQVSKIVKGKVKKRTSIFSSVIADDVTSIGSYIVNDVIVPTVKRAIVDAVSDGVSMLFLGEKTSSKKRTGSGDYISYRDYSRSSRDGYERHSRPSYDDIVFERKSDAEEVLSTLDDIIEEYGVASVNDLYELVGERTEYTKNKYGWTSLRGADIISCRGGYRLKLPKATLI